METAARLGSQFMAHNLALKQLMRIDLVITELDTGGAEKCCAELAFFLLKRGYQVRVIAFGPRPSRSKDRLVRLLETNKVEIHFLGGKSWWMLPRVASKLRRLLKSNQPDVVQSFLWHANVLSAWIVPSLGIPLFGGVRISERRTSRHPFDRWSTSRSTKTICVSQGVADWCVQTEKMDAGKLMVIPNGIAIESAKQSISPNSHSIPTDAKILLFVGRLELQKGIDVLVQHAKPLLRQLPDHHLVLIGDGSMRPNLEALARQKELRGRVHCLGQRDDVRSWMARSELLILPARYEGMPNVILEAMAEGLAVVTTRVEGIVELLGDQLEKQSVEKEAWDDFFELAADLANSPEKQQKIGNANRQRAETEFDLEKQLMQYESLYRLWTIAPRSEL